MSVHFLVFVAVFQWSTAVSAQDIPDVLYTNAYGELIVQKAKRLAQRELQTAGKKSALKTAFLTGHIDDVLELVNPNQWQNLGTNENPLYRTLMPNSRAAQAIYDHEGHLIGAVEAGLVRIKFEKGVRQLRDGSPLIKASVELIDQSRAYRRTLRAFQRASLQNDLDLGDPVLHARFLGAQIYFRPDPEYYRNLSADAVLVLDSAVIQKVEIVDRGPLKDIVLRFRGRLCQDAVSE